MKGGCGGVLVYVVAVLLVYDAAVFSMDS